MHENMWTDMSRPLGGAVSCGKAAESFEGFYDRHESFLLQQCVRTHPKHSFPFSTCAPAEVHMKDGPHLTMIWVAWGYNSAYFRE